MFLLVKVAFLDLIADYFLVPIYSNLQYPLFYWPICINFWPLVYGYFVYFPHSKVITENTLGMFMGGIV